MVTVLVQLFAHQTTADFLNERGGARPCRSLDDDALGSRRARARLSSMPVMTWINAAIMCGALI
jgi:hypothetical protein